MLSDERECLVPVDESEIEPGREFVAVVRREVGGGREIVVYKARVKPTRREHAYEGDPWWLLVEEELLRLAEEVPGMLACAGHILLTGATKLYRENGHESDKNELSADQAVRLLEGNRQTGSGSPG